MDWTGKGMVIMKIISFVFVKYILILCYLYLNPNSSIGYWRLTLGGLEVETSMNILYVAIMTLPDFLFYHYISSKYIRQLKENYVYIFVREKNMANWWRKFFGLGVKHLIIYEVAAVLILLISGIGLQKNIEISISQFIEIILCQLLRLVIIMTICNILLLKFNEMIAVFTNLVIQVVPFFVVGVLYDIDGAWKKAIIYIPFNWYHYNYLIELNSNFFVILGMLVVFEIMLYLYSEVLFRNHEAI